MKNIKSIFLYTLVLVLLAGVATSCNEDVLDSSPYGSKFEESLVWGSRANANAYVNQTYDNVIGNYAGYASLEVWTSNGVKVRDGNDDVAGETYTRESDKGFNRFGNIRRCNLIIEKASSSETLPEGDKTELVAEGKFLRAMTYFYLARRFGRVVWIDRVLTVDEENFNFPLISIKDTYKNIVQDLDDAIAGLPETAVPGKASKYSAAAIKSEVCLQAGAYTGDVSYYQKALDAANLVINEGSFSLDSDYGAIFDERGRFSNEIIFGYYRDQTNTQCNSIQDLQWCVPNMNNDRITRNGGGPLFKSSILIFEAWNDYIPTQTLVDNYLITDAATGEALPWNQTSQFITNMESIGDREWKVKDGVDMVVNDIIYDNSDKRLGASIVHDRSTWFGEDIATKVKGNLNGKLDGGAYNWNLSLTNLYWRKGTYNVNPRVYVGIPTDYHYVITRLGRVYMNKAEALLRQNKPTEAVKAINATRAAHGGLAASTATSLADVWTDYKRERRVELAKERDFYWTLLRWGKYGGEANAGRPAGGVIYELKEEIPTRVVISEDRKSFKIRSFADSGENYNNIERREFTPSKRYQFPIPKSQLDLNPNLDQNPGW